MEEKEIKSHAELVDAAAVWLRNSRKCRIVATEIVTGASETPDAIGFTSRESIVIECKTSRTDFFRNGEKFHEQSERSVGDERWFLTIAGLVQPGEVPDGWGLLEIHITDMVIGSRSNKSRGHFIRRIVHPPRRERTAGSFVAERLMLISIAQRSLEALKQVRPLSLGLGDIVELSSHSDLERKETKAEVQEDAGQRKRDEDDGKIDATS